MNEYDRYIEARERLRAARENNDEQCFHEWRVLRHAAKVLCEEVCKTAQLPVHFDGQGRHFAAGEKEPEQPATPGGCKDYPQAPKPDTAKPGDQAATLRRAMRGGV